MTDFRNFVDSLRDIGFYDVLLPFVLVFTLSYAILSNTKFFDEAENKNTIYTIIAFCFGFLSVFSIWVVEGITQLILYSMIGMIVLFIILLFLAFLFGEKYIEVFKDGDSFKPWFIYGAFGSILLFILGIIFYIFDIFSFFGGNFTNSALRDYSTLFVIILVGVLLYFITKDTK